MRMKEIEIEKRYIRSTKVKREKRKFISEFTVILKVQKIWKIDRKKGPERGFVSNKEIERIIYRAWSLIERKRV